MKEPSMKEKDKCVDSKLWHACAGGMVKMPTVNSMIYYFPQGHAEHAQGFVDFGTLRTMPPFIPCRVTAVKFMADHVNDEVFAKIQIAPIRVNDPDNSQDDGLHLGMKDTVTQEKPVSFAKTLTQSDANNGGGFSIPRYCAETIFPRLDYSADPPVQTVIAKDVHGEAWKFRHIYRGTPRRHLLTTGWSNFVNQKKLVAGDSIVFLRAERDLCIGIRRAKTAGVGDGPETRAGWNLPYGSGRSSYGSFSVFLREEESKLMRGNFGSDGSMRGRSRVRADSVIEAANHAANCQPFEIVYYPRAGTPEFFVNIREVKAAIRIQWCPGMRYKMAFETEDSSRISWFMGTISSVQVADPVRWPSSPWRLLQVTWDEPDILQNVKRVNPWLVEIVSSMPTIHLAHLSPQRKRPRFSQNPDFPFEAQFQSSMVTRNHLFPRDSLFSCFSDSPSAGIQGARHTQFGVSLPNIQFNKMRTGLFHPGIHQLDHATQSSRISAGVSAGNPLIQNSLSCFGHPSETLTKSCDGKSPQLMLFGQPILTEQQVFLSKLENKICHDATVNNSSEGNLKKQVNKFDGLVSAVIQKTSLVTFPFHDDLRTLELDIGAGHCKVFMESDDVGRTLNLSNFGSYEELYRKLADMFGIKELRMMSHVLYKDAAGAIKHTGDEPFSDFMKTARRLTILTDSRSDNLAR